MKRFATAAAVLVGCWLSVSMAEQVEESEKPSSGYSGGYPGAYPGSGQPTEGRERIERGLPKIPNVVPDMMQNRHDEFLSDLRVGQAADYTEPGLLTVYPKPKDAAGYRILRITPAYIDLDSKDLRIRLRASAITAIHIYKSGEAP
jgi:hypothetical protein